jgi:hypothetical protein
VVNGITGMENFKPIETIKSRLPIVIMLSHVWYMHPFKITPWRNNGHLKTGELVDLISLAGL